MSEWNLVKSRETDSSESENTKIASKNNVDCIFYATSIIHHGFASEKQTVNGKF
jgi:hypothetical protein